MDVRPAKVVVVPPNATLVLPIVTDELVNAELGMFVSVLVDPLIDLFVSVWEPVKVATVESIAIVTGEPPSKLVPVSPVPIVKALVVLAVIVAEPPKAAVWPLKVTELLVRLELPMLLRVLVDPLIDLLVNV